MGASARETEPEKAPLTPTIAGGCPPRRGAGSLGSQGSYRREAMAQGATASYVRGKASWPDAYGSGATASRHWRQSPTLLRYAQQQPTSMNSRTTREGPRGSGARGTRKAVNPATKAKLVRSAGWSLEHAPATRRPIQARTRRRVSDNTHYVRLLRLERPRGVIRPTRPAGVRDQAPHPSNTDNPSSSRLGTCPTPEGLSWFGWHGCSPCAWPALVCGLPSGC